MQSTKNKAMIDFFEDSAYSMINVGKKKITHRKALAMGKIFLKPDVLQKVRLRTLEKGDALTLAEISGIQGAKLTSTLLPLCHPLSLDSVAIKTEVNETQGAVEIFCYVTTHAKTGVEMEAISGVQAALLCIYDLCKMYGHDMSVSDIRLLYKTGGKQGAIIDQTYLPKTLAILVEDAPHALEGKHGAVLTISDRASQGQYEDKSGPVLVDALKKEGAMCESPIIVPDDKEMIQATIKQLVSDRAPNLIMTTGGTGVGPRDVTPDAISEIVQYEIPGIGELLRQDGLHFTPYATLSRAIAGCYENTLIIALPGSTKAIGQAMAVLSPVLGHLLDMIKGDGHD